MRPIILKRCGQVLATLLLAPVAFSCGGNSSAGAVPDALPKFVETSKQVGFTIAQGQRIKEPNCLFDPKLIVAQFPKVTPPAVSKDVARQCDPERSSGGAAAVDVNGDGLDDIVMTRIYNAPLLYLNTSTKDQVSFVDATKGTAFEKVPSSTNGVGYADIDNDGDQDVVITSLGGKQLYMFINDGTGKFTEEAVARGVAMIDGRPHSGMGVSFGDYNNDGWLDMHTNEWQPSDVSAYAVPSHSRLFKNLGASGKPGVFVDATKEAGVELESRVDLVYSFSSSFTDFDSDGNVDLMVASDFNTTRFYWNNGDGTFTNGTVDAELGKEENAMGLAVGFMGKPQKQVMMVTSIRAKADCDDASDLILTGNRLFEYSGKRVFSDITDKAGVRNGFWGWGTSFLDSTNAAKKEIASANGMDITWMPPSACYASDPFRFWVDNGNGVFTEKSIAAGIDINTPSKGVVIFDADNDGRQDMFVTRDANKPLFFHNQTPSVGAWLGITVQGTTTNRDGLGALVSVTAVEGEEPQLAYVGTSGSFLTHDGRVKHFGLGKLTTNIFQVKVTFPASGKEVVLNNVKSQQVINVTEPE